MVYIWYVPIYCKHIVFYFSVVQARFFIICSNVDVAVEVVLFGILMINTIFARSFASQTHINAIIV